jgi:predicted nucleic acid-binding protein
MMHHILYINTKPFPDYESDLIPKLYHIVCSNIGGRTVIYFIMDLMSTSLHNRLATIHTYHGRLFEFIRCIAQIRPTLEITKQTAASFGVLAATVKQSGRSPRPRYNDLWMAAQAIEHGYELLTLNTRDFEDLPGLRLTSLQP